MSTALATQHPAPLALLRPIAPPAAIIEAQNAAREMVHAALKEGRDYGVIPGTGKKPSMLKPGAERVALGFGCYYGTPEIIEKEVDHDREVRYTKNGQANTSLGLYRYVVRVPVINRATGEAVGSGVGSCSSMEAKYISRPRDVENTILKMAYKRAMVAACLTTFGLSDEFTQDVEDLVANREERDNETEAADRASTAAAPLTVEQALAMPLPGKDGAWNGQAGKPLGQLAPKHLASIHQWADKKVAGDIADGKAPSPNIVQLRDACALIVQMRGPAPDKTQTKMELGGEAEQRQNPPAGAASNRTTGGADSPTTSSKATSAGSTTPESKDPSFADLATSIDKLLRHEKLTDPERKDFKQRAAAAQSLGALELLIGELETLIEAPF